MELKVTTLEGKEAGSVQLSDAIFGLEPRQDIIARCVQWQLNKRQAGTHKAKGRAEIYRSIAAPSAAIEPDYPTYTVATRDGRVFSGVVRAEALVKEARSASLPTAIGTGIYTRLDSDRTLKNNGTTSVIAAMARASTAETARQIPPRLR